MSLLLAPEDLVDLVKGDISQDQMMEVIISHLKTRWEADWPYVNFGDAMVS